MTLQRYIFGFVFVSLRVLVHPVISCSNSNVSAPNSPSFSFRCQLFSCSMDTSTVHWLPTIKTTVTRQFCFGAGWYSLFGNHYFIKSDRTILPLMKQMQNKDANTVPEKKERNNVKWSIARNEISEFHRVSPSETLSHRIWQGKFGAPARETTYLFLSLSPIILPKPHQRLYVFSPNCNNH